MPETGWLHNGCGAPVTTADGGATWHCLEHAQVAPANVTAIDPKCDFCSCQPVTHALPAGDFLVPGDEGHGSAGRWLACGACAALIGNGEWAGLLRRAVEIFAAKYHADRPALRRVLNPTYDRLRRTAGELVPFTPERSSP